MTAMQTAFGKLHAMTSQASNDPFCSLTETHTGLQGNYKTQRFDAVIVHNGEHFVGRDCKAPDEAVESAIKQWLKGEPN